MEDKKTVSMPDNDEEFFKIADMRLKMMEDDYQRTLAAEKIKDNFEMKGKFEQTEFNNVQFENNEENISANKEELSKDSKENQKKEVIDEKAEEDNEINHDEYQQLSDNSDQNKEDDEEDWGVMQTAEIKNEENSHGKEQKISIDSEKIKSIMAKIQLKPPEWATSPDIWKIKLTQLCKDINT